MSLIELTDLTFSYEGSPTPVFEGLNLRLDSDWRLGVIGRNGRGKTTLLRLLEGGLEYRGRITSSVVFDYFPFPIPQPEKPALEAALEARPEVEEWRLRRELGLLALEEETVSRPFSTLSNGEQTRLLLGLLFACENAFLLIDEPTNHLDAAGRELVAGYLAKKSGFLLVSHDRAFLDRCVDHVLVFNRTGLEVQKGNFSTWWRNQESREHFERGEQERLKKEIARLQASARRTEDWSRAAERAKWGSQSGGVRPDRGFLGHRAAKVMKRAKSTQARREAAVEDKARLLQDAETAQALKLHPLEHAQSRMLRAECLAVDYGSGPVFRPVSFTLTRGERIALQGCNGVGKSSLLKLIGGQELSHTGVLWRAGGTICSLVPQDISFLRGSLRQFAEENRIDESLFKTILRKLGFARALFERDIGEYSAGQKKKVLLARSLSQSAHIYLWDEPLNYVDVYSRIQLEELLLQADVTMIFVEHDQAFSRRVATKVVELQRPEST